MRRPPQILHDPWLISEAGASLVWAFWERDGARLAQEGKAGPFDNQGGSYAKADGIGVIKVLGPIARHATMISDASGATTDDAIRSGLALAVADPAVQSIVLNLDSPGGEARGAAETADAIRAASKVKPVIAYVAGQAASKAYWFASAADKIVATRDAEVGSIGVRVSLLDESGAEQQAGIRRVEVVSTASPGKRATPVDDAVIARAQARADEIAGVFLEDVARGRGVSAATVAEKFGAGGMMLAGAALSVGMIDAIGNFNDALALAKSAANQRSKKRMENPDLNGALSAATGFRDAVLAALGTDSEGVALARLADGVKARTELDAFRGTALRDKFMSAVSGGRLELGELSRVVPHLYGENRKAAADAVAGVAKQEAGEIVAALCRVPVSANAWEAINAYLDEKQPNKRLSAVPAVEPADVAKVADPNSESVDFAQGVYNQRFRGQKAAK